MFLTLVILVVVVVFVVRTFTAEEFVSGFNTLKSLVAKAEAFIKRQLGS